MLSISSCGATGYIRPTRRVRCRHQPVSCAAALGPPSKAHKSQRSSHARLCCASSIQAAAFLPGYKTSSAFGVSRASAAHGAVSAGSRSNRSRNHAAVKVVAFRDTHRSDQMVSCAREFGSAWGSCLSRGPAPDTIDCISQLSDEGIVLHAVHPMGCICCKGVDALTAKLEADYKLYYAPHSQTPSGSTTIATSEGFKGGITDTTAAFEIPPSQPPTHRHERRAHVIAVAANDDTDVAFALLELPVPHGPGFESEKGDQDQAAYVLLKMDIQLDDTTRRVTRVVERGMLPANFSFKPETQEPRASVDMHASPQHHVGCAAATVPFPTDLLKPWACYSKSDKELQKPGSQAGSPTDSPAAPPSGGPQAAKGGSYSMPSRAVRAQSPTSAGADAAQAAHKLLTNHWCAAFNTGADAHRLIQEAVVGDSFRSIQAYNWLPLLTDPQYRTDIEATAPYTSAHKPGEPSPSMCPTTTVIGTEPATHIINSTKSAYRVRNTVVDSAVSLEQAVGFTHWRANLDDQKTGRVWEVEGMEVDLFDPASGKLAAVYEFRDGLMGHK